MMSIFLLLILLFAGLAFLSSKSSAYRGAAAAGPALIARGLAQAGMEDARVKLQKDLFFPPVVGEHEQNLFSYTENLSASGSSELTGTYTVSIDTRLAAPPYNVIRVTSIGRWAPPSGSSASHVISAEMLLTGADAYRYSNWQEDRRVSVP
jgi:hypothetical protein